jgi:hypothetical protein
MDATSGDAAKNPERMPLPVEEHPLTGRAFPQERSREGHAFATGKRTADVGPVPAPIELERFARCPAPHGKPV